MIGEQSREPLAPSTWRQGARGAQTADQLPAESTVLQSHGSIPLHISPSGAALKVLLQTIRADRRGWDSAAGTEVVQLIRASVRREEARWRGRAGDLGEAAVSEVWEALAHWVNSGDTTDPIVILRAQTRRKVASHAAAAQTGIGTPRTAGLCGLARQMVVTELPPSDILSEAPHSGAETVPVPEWMQVLGAMLLRAGWAWPIPPTDALVAAAEVAVHSKRRGRSALGKHPTGVPAGTWSALEILVAGSAPSRRIQAAWPSPAVTYRTGGAAAVQDSTEVQRLVRSAVAGSPARSGRVWRKTAEFGSVAS